MNKFLIPAVAATLLAGAAAPALAAPAQAINYQQNRVEQRIQTGLRNGALTWREAAVLRGQLAEIGRIEVRYRHNGLNNWERADLDRRLDRLSAQVRIQRNDRQVQHYGPIFYGHR